MMSHANIALTPGHIFLGTATHYRVKFFTLAVGVLAGRKTGHRILIVTYELLDGYLTCGVVFGINFFHARVPGPLDSLHKIRLDGLVPKVGRIFQ